MCLWGRWEEKGEETREQGAGNFPLSFDITGGGTTCREESKSKQEGGASAFSGVYDM